MSNTKHFWARGEVRLNGDGTVDEVVTGQVQGVHVEQMDDDCFWVGIYGKDDRRMVLYFHREGKKIRLTVEDDGDHSSGISSGFAKPPPPKPPTRDMTLPEKRARKGST